MHTVGIDLSARGEHKAVIVDEGGRFVSSVFHFGTAPASLRRLLEMSQANNPDQQVQAVMEPTGMAWFPVAVFLIRNGVTVYLVNSQQVADLRKYFKKHAKSDRIDARVLAKLPLVDAEKLHRLELASAKTLACQRGCKQLERLMKQRTACQNRIIALDRFAWPGLEETVFGDLFCSAALWFREHWYDPLRVLGVGAEAICEEWMNASSPAAQDRSSALSPAPSQPQPGNHSRCWTGWGSGLSQFHWQPQALPRFARTARLEWYGTQQQTEF